MEPIPGQIVPDTPEALLSRGARINLNEAITELNLPRLICIHPVNSIIYVNAAEVLELIRLPVRTVQFSRREESEREGRRFVRKRRGGRGKREIKIRGAIKHFAEIASGLIRGIISRARGKGKVEGEMEKLEKEGMIMFR